MELKVQDTKTRKSFTFISEIFIDPGDREIRHMRRLQPEEKRYVDSLVNVLMGVVETLESTANFLARAGFWLSGSQDRLPK